MRWACPVMLNSMQCLEIETLMSKGDWAAEICSAIASDVFIEAPWLWE
jgi:hypothetical protein